MNGHCWRSTKRTCTRTLGLLAFAVGCISGLGGCEQDQGLTQGVDAARHEPWFPIGPDAQHALGAAARSGPIDCVSCHDGTETFREPMCLSCHQSDVPTPTEAHGEIAGYLAEDTACYGCHPRGTREGPQGVGDHSSVFFPIDATDAHGGASYLDRVGGSQTSCTACHADVEDRSVTLCAECHAADTAQLSTVHGALTRSFQNDSTACKACHASTPVEAYMTPLSNHAAIATSHHSATCQSCHQTWRAAPQDWALDFSAYGCTPCHSSACTIETPGACD